MNINDKKYLNIVEHYESCLDKFGDSHLGVDWPKKDDADKRYGIMLELIKVDDSKRIKLLDFGCGASHLYDFIIKNSDNKLSKIYNKIEYSGLDISQKFVDLSKNKFPENKYYCIDILEENSSIPQFDYIIMNGVFTEKCQLSFDEMFDYFKLVLGKVYKNVIRGIAFNVMSKNVDWEREDLFHLSLDKLTSFLVAEISRNFVIRNDYGLYEYTVYVYR